MYVIVGIKDVNYVNKQNREIHGMNVFTEYEDKRVEGVATDEFYISQALLDDSGVEGLSVGDSIEVFYNKFGKVASMKKVNA